MAAAQPEVENPPMPPHPGVTDDLLSRMADDLIGINGVSAVALGGSRARGDHAADSDHDLGVHYRRDQLDVAGLATVAEKWTGRPTPIAAPGQWGPWVDGGAWLRVADSPVDWILREVDRVEEQVRRAIAGDFDFHTQPGHPLGFLDVSYAGEVAIAVPLADPTSLLARWKRHLNPYPDALRAALVANTWQVEFDLGAARKGARREDSAYVVLCCTHAAMMCAHAWCAQAGVWVTNEKGLIPGVAQLPVETGTFSRDVQEVLGHLSSSGSELHKGIDDLQDVLGAAIRHLSESDPRGQ